MEAVDLLVRARTGTAVTVVAVREGRIVHVGGDSRALDDAASGAAQVIDRPGVVLPGFVDTHNHLMLAARNRLGVAVATASSVGEIVERISVRAESTRVGEWVVTGADWHELALPERRLPTRAELDGATKEHPVLVQRGGHVGMLNTAGLRAAGFSASEPVSGAERDEHGALTGRVEDQALHTVQGLLPPRTQTLWSRPLPKLRSGTPRPGSWRYATRQSAQWSGRPINASMAKVSLQCAAER